MRRREPAQPHQHVERTDVPPAQSGQPPPPARPGPPAETPTSQYLPDQLSRRGPASFPSRLPLFNRQLHPTNREASRSVFTGPPSIRRHPTAGARDLLNDWSRYGVAIVGDDPVSGPCDNRGHHSARGCGHLGSVVPATSRSLELDRGHQAHAHRASGAELTTDVSSDHCRDLWVMSGRTPALPAPGPASASGRANFGLHGGRPSTARTTSSRESSRATVGGA